MGCDGTGLSAHLAVFGPAFHRRQIVIAVEHVKLCGLIQLIPYGEERRPFGFRHFLLCCYPDDFCQHVFHPVFHVTDSVDEACAWLQAQLAEWAVDHPGAGLTDRVEQVGKLAE